MRKRNRIILSVVLLSVVIVVVTLILPTRSAKGTTSYNIDSPDSEWSKQFVTEITPHIYSNDIGNTITLYICHTTYYAASPNKQSVLNTDAISGVIEPDSVDSRRTCSVNNLPAELYKKADLAYLCWTITPEYSCVIEYAPSTEDEADIFRMAESIPTEITP